MPLKVMLVDDNHTFLAAMRQFLDLLPGLDIVSQANSGKEALAQLRLSTLDLVLLDIAMPGMNGLELARAIRQSERPPRMIFLSMHDNDEYRAAADELDAGFVSKADFVAELLPMLELMVQARDGNTPSGGRGPGASERQD